MVGHRHKAEGWIIICDQQLWLEDGEELRRGKPLGGATARLRLDVELGEDSKAVMGAGNLMRIRTLVFRLMITGQGKGRNDICPITGF